MTRRELAKGAAAALLAAPALLPAISEAPPLVTFTGHPITGVVDGAYIQQSIRANHVSVNQAGEMTLVYEREIMRIDGETDAQLRARLRGGA